MMQKDLHNKQMIVLLNRRMLILIFVTCASFAGIVSAQTEAETEIPITPEPVGSGARALGQSAFIAVVDDATAASWNPAGLIQLEKPEASFVGAWKAITKDFSSPNDRVSIDQESWDKTQINFMSYARPVEIWNKDMVISVNYHQVYDFGVEYSGLIIEEEGPTEIKGRSDGAVSAYSMAGAFSMPSYPEISFGASFNWYAKSLFNDHAWQVKQTWIISWWDDLFEPSFGEYKETFDDFQGYNFTFGLLWDVYERQENLLTLGLVYHTPFTAEVDREININYAAGGGGVLQDSMDIDFPASIGAGLNYRISDALSVAFDIEWKEWSKFKKVYANGTSKSPYGSDTMAYRLGAEQLIFLGDVSESVLACRGGLFYEPRPESSYPNPSKLKIYGLSAGLGWTVKDQFSMDFAYQYRWAEQGSGIIDYDYREHLFVGSLIIYF